MFKKYGVKVVLLDYGRGLDGQMVHEISHLDPALGPWDAPLARTWQVFESESKARDFMKTLQADLDVSMNADVDRDRDFCLYTAAIVST